MTLLAVRSKLALVNIGVTVGALGTYVGEHRLRMALRTRHALVHATEGKLRQVMVELGNATDRLPPRRGMAVLARHVQVAVRAACVCVVLGLAHGRSAGAQQQQRNQQIKRDFQTHRALRLNWTRAKLKSYEDRKDFNCDRCWAVNVLLNE